MSPQYIHAKIAIHLGSLLLEKYPDIDWLAEYDIKIPSNISVRPDITGLDKSGSHFVFIEISDTSLDKDTNVAFPLYQALKIPYFFIVNCQHLQVLKYKLNGEGQYQPTDDFPEISKAIFSVLTK